MSFPIYDGHGNNIASLVRTGSSYALSSQKGYDVWGGVRLGSAGAGNRYCGNLGHQQDDESGLIYMRARYYEPGSGRFISEDPARDGMNWYAYCENNPINRVDSSGQMSDEERGTILYVFGLIMVLSAGGLPSPMLAAMDIAQGLLNAKAFVHWYRFKMRTDEINKVAGLVFKETSGRSYAFREALRIINGMPGGIGATLGLGARVIQAASGYALCVLGTGVYYDLWD